MAEPEKRGDGRSWLILEYVRTLMWPVVVMLLLLIYRSDVSELLKTREIDILGVRVGQALPEFKDNLQQELDDLKMLAAAGEAGPLNDKIDAISQRLNTEVETIQQAAPEPPAAMTSSTNKKSTAKDYEWDGFQAILDRDADRAIEMFRKAEDAWPDYHNVSEIRRFLERNRDALTSADDARRKAAWASCDQAMLTKYSWGMPASAREKLRAGLEASRPPGNRN